MNILPKEKVAIEAFGTIERMEGDTAHYLASGFVCLKPNIVLTCLHVVKDIDSLYYHPGSHRKNYLLTKKATFAPLDLAVLELPEGIKITPLKLTDNEKISVGDTIDYLGYDRPTTESNEHVTLTGKQSKLISIDRNYLYFEGYCHTGYSGAPILNMESKVIGMISAGKVLSKEENFMQVKCSRLDLDVVSKYIKD